MVVNCPLCGYRFDSAQAVSCKGCPINSDCSKICCPNCSYGWVNSSSIVDSLLGLFKQGKKNGKP